MKIETEKVTKYQLSIIETAVFELIPQGIEKKTSLSEIGKLVDIDIRSLQATILTLIKKGIPIVAIRGSVEGGIFIATTDEEREIGLKSLVSQANEMLYRAQLVRKCDLSTWKNKVSSSYQDQLGVTR